MEGDEFDFLLMGLALFFSSALELLGSDPAVSVTAITDLASVAIVVPPPLSAIS